MDLYYYVFYFLYIPFTYIWPNHVKYIHHIVNRAHHLDFYAFTGQSLALSSTLRMFRMKQGVTWLLPSYTPNHINNAWLLLIIFQRSKLVYYSSSTFIVSHKPKWFPKPAILKWSGKSKIPMHIRSGSVIIPRQFL